jgi:predicted amidophosphoribosyltransferase
MPNTAEEEYEDDTEESVPTHTCLCCGASFPESENTCPECGTQYGDDGDGDED